MTELEDAFQNGICNVWQKLTACTFWCIINIHTVNMPCVSLSVRQKMLAHSDSASTPPCFSSYILWPDRCHPVCQPVLHKPSLKWWTHFCLCMWRLRRRKNVWNINSLGLQYSQWRRWDLMGVSQLLFLFSVLYLEFSSKLQAAILIMYCIF